MTPTEKLQRLRAALERAGDAPGVVINTCDLKTVIDETLALRAIPETPPAAPAPPAPPDGDD